MRGRALPPRETLDTEQPADRPVPISSNLRAALFMVIAMAGFTLNDAVTKHVMETLGFAQVMLIRGIFATILIFLLAKLDGYDTCCSDSNEHAHGHNNISDGEGDGNS